MGKTYNFDNLTCTVLRGYLKKKSVIHNENMAFEGPVQGRDPKVNFFTFKIDQPLNLGLILHDNDYIMLYVLFSIHDNDYIMLFYFQLTLCEKFLNVLWVNKCKLLRIVTKEVSNPK